jgi:hypothetical protein
MAGRGLQEGSPTIKSIPIATCFTKGLLVDLSDLASAGSKQLRLDMTGRDWI